MSTLAVVVIVIVVLVVIGAVAYFAQAQARRRSLQQRFGPEYDRTVENHESTKEAEQELLARKKRHDELDIQPLDPASRERHLTEWRQVQERFVDAPETAVTEADRLLTLVMGERGYPTEGYEQQVADLSVEHAGTIDRYRTAHDISARAQSKEASTEDLRQAMVHYRTLFNELLETGDDAAEAGPNGTAHAATDTTDATDATAADARSERAEADRAETDRAEAARTDATRTDAARTDAARTDATRAEAEPTETETAAAERTETAGTATRTGRRGARRDNEDEGA